MVKVMAEKLLGLVANIQRYSLNDGPGTRTTVFVKGCPLRCRWCHNPEMIRTRNEVWYNPVLCTNCGKCLEVCPESAIKGCKDERVIDRDVCTSEACLKCVEVCQNHAMNVVAKWMTVEDVVKEVQKDAMFYRYGGGGCTVSGGEPSLQYQFVTEVLKECQSRGIHTVLDTCGYTSWDVLSQIANYSDLILFDVKHMNSVKHQWGTGVSNELILENAKKLSRVDKLRIRVPVIPGFNDSEEELREIAYFVKSNGIEDVDLLPFHSYASGKYKMYLMKYEFAETTQPSDEHMEEVKVLTERYGLHVTVGG